jgi:hypothetical protein
LVTWTCPWSRYWDPGHFMLLKQQGQATIGRKHWNSQNKAFPCFKLIFSGILPQKDQHISPLRKGPIILITTVITLASVKDTYRHQAIYIHYF